MVLVEPGSSRWACEIIHRSELAFNAEVDRLMVLGILVLLEFLNAYGIVRVIWLDQLWCRGRVIEVFVEVTGKKKTRD